MSLTYEITPCPACNGQRSVQLAGRDEVLRELEELWTFHARRLHPATPPQHLADRLVFSQHPPLRVVRCPECGLVFRNPRERARELVDAYASEAPDPRALRALFDTQLDSQRAQAARLTRVAGRVGSGVEVGSYLGAFLQAARESGWSFEGLDVNPHAVRFAREQGLHAHHGTLEDFRPGRTYDVVAIWNTFEQLPDPRAAAQAARALLAPGGLLVLRVPDGGFYAALRRLRGGPLGGVARSLLAHNNLLGFPYRHGFTPGSLQALLDGLGYRTVRVVGDTLVPIADQYTVAWAAWEERVLKTLLRRLSRLGVHPWFEIYARAC